MALNSPTKVWMWIKVMNFGLWVKWKVEITVDLRLLSSIISQDRALSGFITCTFTVICYVTFNVLKIFHIEILWTLWFPTKLSFDEISGDQPCHFQITFRRRCIRLTLKLHVLHMLILINLSVEPLLLYSIDSFFLDHHLEWFQRIEVSYMKLPPSGWSRWRHG